MTMPVRWSRVAAFGCVFAVSALTGVISSVSVAKAEDYRGLATVRSGRMNAIVTDPFDPVPQIGWGCHHCRRHDWRRHSSGYEPWHRHDWRRDDRDTSLVDCSGRDPHAFRSVSEAALHTPPNGRILILPPGQGMTCVETLHAFGPVTISSTTETQAVIEAPPHSPCLIADIPLGDTLTVENVAFIARGRDEPCVRVQAGRVVVRNSHIDSRNTDWAFDVKDSGYLSLEDSRIETDGSGVFARRATVELHNVEIDVEEGENGTGLFLDRTDGLIEGGTILGGRLGAEVSSGPRGLHLERLVLRKTGTALRIEEGQQGAVTAERLELFDNRDGIVVAPGAQASLDGIVVRDTHGVAVALNTGGVRLTASRIRRAATGVALNAHGALIARNLIANVSYAGIDVSNGGHAAIVDNTIYAPGHARCLRGTWDAPGIEEHNTTCRDEWLHEPPDHND